jgi:hypothetical protein
VLKTSPADRQTLQHGCSCAGSTQRVVVKMTNLLVPTPASSGRDPKAQIRRRLSRRGRPNRNGVNTHPTQTLPTSTPPTTLGALPWERGRLVRNGVNTHPTQTRRAPNHQPPPAPDVAADVFAPAKPEKGESEMK